MVAALTLHRGAGGGHSEVLAGHIGQRGNAGLLGDHHLIGVKVQAGDDLQIVIGVTLETVGAVEALVAVAGDGNGHLGLVLGYQSQVLDAAGRGLAGGADIIDLSIPQIGDGGADGV